MIKVSDIKSPITEELSKFEVHFRESMQSKVPLLDKMTHYIIKRKGKQMRPMFVFLSAKMLGEVNPDTYNSASLIELLHTARSEEHTSELQSRPHLVCRLLLE